jgi:hypothetical protein
MPVPTKRSVHSIRESPAGNIPDRSYRSVYHPPINGRSRYETFKLIADDPTWDEDFIAQGRQAYPQWCDPAVYSVGESQAFAKEFAGLSFRESFAMYNKQSFWNIRVGITRFTDETTRESLRNFVHDE